MITDAQRGLLNMLREQHAPYEMGFYVLTRDFGMPEDAARMVMREYCDELRAQSAAYQTCVVCLLAGVSLLGIFLWLTQ